MNGFGNLAVAEPFAGGAGAALSMLFSEETPEILINDADRSIADFWWAVTQCSDRFDELIATSVLDIHEWRRQRAVYRDANATRMQRGFSTFYLNRCNRSGIISNGGPIGGIAQRGEWRMDVRFNRDELRKRCRKVAEFASRIHVSGKDGLVFLGDSPGAVFLFIDPPYFNKGKLLYLNALDHEYHASLGRQLRTMPSVPWVLTYDDCPEIRRIYEGWATIKSFSLRYTAFAQRAGREVLITPEWMKLPEAHSSSVISW